MGTPKKHENRQLRNDRYFKLLPIVFIAFVWFVFSNPYFLKKLVPFPSTYLVSFFNPWNNYYGMPVKNGAMPDVITQIYPWKKITVDSLKAGKVALWNPYQFSGNPHLANVQSAVFTPFNLLFFILPFIDAWSILILLQPLCAGLFMYVFLRSLRVSRYAGMLGSISFMFCSFMVTWMAYGTLGYALLFLPLFLYGIERYIAKKDSVATMLLILSTPLTIFSGHFQTSLYVLIFGFCYLFARCAQERNSRILVMPIIYIGIGVCIASFQIIPTYRFYAQSVRSGSYIQDEAIPGSQLIRSVAPDFFGNPVTRNDWMGHYAEWGTYAGVIPLLLALFAVLNQGNKFSTYFFGGTLITALFFSFQPQFISLLAYSKIPVLATSTPSRIVGIISFCIAVLGAYGLDAVIEAWKTGKISKQAMISIIIPLMTTGLLWFLIQNMEGDPETIAKRNFILPTGLIVIAVSIFVAGYIRHKYVKIFLPILFILLTSFEMLRFSMKWMPFDPREYVYPESPSIAYLQENARGNRVYGLLGNEVFGMFNLQGIEGYDPLYTKRYGEFISATSDGKIQQPARSTVIFPRSGRYAKQILDILGVKYIVHSKGDGRGSWVFPFWEYPNSFLQVFADEKYEIYENKEAFPRAFLVNSYKIVKEEQKIVDEILLGTIDMRNNIILEEEPKNSRELTSCDVPNLSEQVSIVNYFPTEITVSTQSPCSSLLFLSDVYYPGWVAYVDGNKAPVYRANYTFRAVPIPAGGHEIIFKYENWYL